MKQDASSLEELRPCPTRGTHCCIWLSEIHSPADLGEEAAKHLARVQVSVLTGDLESDPESEHGSDCFWRKQIRRLLLVGFLACLGGLQPSPPRARGIILPFFPWVVSPIWSPRLIPLAAASCHLTERINVQNGIRLGVGESTDAAIQPNWITLRLPPHRRVMLPLAGVEHPTRIRRLLAREAQREIKRHTVPVRFIGRRLIAQRLALAAPFQDATSHTSSITTRDGTR